MAKSLHLVKNGKTYVGKNPFKQTFSCFKAEVFFKGGENRIKRKSID